MSTLINFFSEFHQFVMSSRLHTSSFFCTTKQLLKINLGNNLYRCRSSRFR